MCLDNQHSKETLRDLDRVLNRILLLASRHSPLEGYHFVKVKPNQPTLLDFHQCFKQIKSPL